MPTYEFLHDTTECKHGWEEELSIKAADPTKCPKCGAEGNITRLINCSTKGVVELYGQELIDKCVADGKKLKDEASRDTKKYANLLGEERYHQLQTKMDQQKRSR